MNGSFSSFHATSIENARTQWVLLRILGTASYWASGEISPLLKIITPLRHLAMAVSACSLAIAFSGTPAVANPLDALVSPQADGAEAQDLGYKRTYTIHADSAWLADGRVLSPAYITLTKGVITRISSREPQAQKTLLGSGPKPKIIKVDGTLAAGVVDAWSSVLPAEIRLDRRPLPFSKVADGLPIQVEGADPALAAAVAAQRSAGVSAAYIGRADGNLMRGLGVPAGFSAHDLPYLEGHEFLDLMVAGDALGVQRGITDLNTFLSSFIAVMPFGDDL